MLDQSASWRVILAGTGAKGVLREEVLMKDEKKSETKRSGVGATASPKDKKLPENSKKSLDRKLDEGIEETFPASDPVSVKITK
jgi:hypothetical protein